MSAGFLGSCDVMRGVRSKPPPAASHTTSALASAAMTMATRRTRRRLVLLLTRIFEIGVAVQAVLVEAQDAAGFLEVHAAVAHGDLDLLPQLAQQHVGVELDVVQHFLHGVAL